MTTLPPPKDPIWSDAVWPVPVWKGERPVISDGFKRHAEKDARTGRQLHRQHLGVDIMFRNARAQKPKVPTTTAWHHCASGDVPMLAALAGEVWTAERTSTGFTVHIDHGSRYGAPLVTYYTHMSSLLVRKGQVVPSGALIGIVGNDPRTKNDPNHCHFEIWDYSEGSRPRELRCVDPGPYLKVWKPIALRRDASGRIAFDR